MESKPKPRARPKDTVKREQQHSATNQSNAVKVERITEKKLGFYTKSVLKLKLQEQELTKDKISSLLFKPSET